jgi:uncharacterized protein (DUF1501 family)
MKPMHSRRAFLRNLGGALASTTLIGSLGGPRSARAASNVSGYKALVCVYLTGGNDGFNWIVPVTASAYSTYAASRSTLALASSALLPLHGTASDGNAYGLHPSCPNLQSLFNAGNAAVVGNVGPLVQPGTVAQARSGSLPLPPQLFSHIDQSTEWMTAYANSPNRFGWAGRIADLLTAQGNSTNLGFNFAIGGTNYWQAGQVTNPYALGTNGAPTTNIFTSNLYRNGARAQVAKALLTQAAADPNLQVATHAAIWQSAGTKATLVSNALGAAGDLATVFPPAATGNVGDWGLSQQLHEVARVIKAQSQIGDARQLFFVQMGGFDTHDAELTTQAALLGYLDSYIDVFWQAMNEINQQDNVTLFTMSDFGRTLTTNNDGTDHGWGSHHMVVGGAVKGGIFYGSMPSLAVGGANDFGMGRLMPTTAVDQYAATLAGWFGISASDLATVFPNLANFATANLGFLG